MEETAGLETVVTWPASVLRMTDDLDVSSVTVEVGSPSAVVDDISVVDVVSAIVDNCDDVNGTVDDDTIVDSTVLGDVVVVSS